MIFIVLTACTTTVPGQPSSPPTVVNPSLGNSPSAPEPPANENTESLLLLSNTAGCAIEGDLEGKFTVSSEMPYFLECLIPQVEEWISWAYNTEMPPPAAYLFVPAGQSGTFEGCPFDDQAFQYCLSSYVVIMGEASTWVMYRGIGDAAPAMGLAHEVGHHFQLMMELPQADPTVPNEQVRFEDQADCVAGAWAKYSVETVFFDPDDDIVDVAGALEFIADKEYSADSTHDRADVRTQSFDIGYLSTHNNGLYSCNIFVREKDLTWLQ
jgi:uncharacterized protein